MSPRIWNGREEKHDKELNFPGKQFAFPARSCTGIHLTMCVYAFFLIAFLSAKDKPGSISWSGGNICSISSLFGRKLYTHVPNWGRNIYMHPWQRYLANQKLIKKKTLINSKALRGKASEKEHKRVNKTTGSFFETIVYLACSHSICYRCYHFLKLSPQVAII